MKNLMKIMIVVGVFTLFAFTPVAVKEPEDTCLETSFEIASVEEEALWCKVETDDGRTISCILCNCKKLAEAAK